MLDAITIQVTGGNGGHGLVSFLREKFVPNGGPEGGDGGPGGNVIFRAVDDVYTLEQYRAKSKFQATNGGNGGRNNRRGSAGGDLTLLVPVGTLVTDDETGDVLADFTEPDQEAVVAYGGRGGWGNKRFATSTNQTPNYSQSGHSGETRQLRLELRMLADVGLLGLPNAGKSTLLAAMSNAKPKIAAYPFTTLEPMLGVVNVNWERFTLADIPGLVEGASEGYGLGFEFLKHVRRCRVLLHLVDCSSPDPVTDYELIEGEVHAYDPDLDAIPRVIAITKADLDEDTAKHSAELLAAHTGREVHVISADEAIGTEALAKLLMERVREARAVDADRPVELAVIRPPSDERFLISKVAQGVFAIEGRGPVTFVEMMNLNEEAARHEIYRRMDRWGMSRALERAGAVAGDRLIFGEVELRWQE